MTAIVGILNTHGVAIAADSATTFSSNDNVQKVHNKANKIFAISKKHSIGIAIYNAASFMEIPWEVVIKMYRKQLEDTMFDTVEDCKSDFIQYLNSYLQYITPESKKTIFYQHYSTIYNELVYLFETAFVNADAALTISADKPTDVQNIINDILLQQTQTVDANTKNPAFTLTFEEFVAEYDNELDEFINAFRETIIKTLAGYIFTPANIASIKRIFFTITQWEFIYENHSGLVFIGYGEKEVFPSSHLVLIGNVIHNTIRHRIMVPSIIKPGVNDGEIRPYAQADVTFSVLKGIDPNVEEEMNKSITKSFEDLITYMQPKFTDGDEADKIRALATGLITQIKDYNFNKITAPIVKMLNCMDKEDMADLAESLVNITSLRRKFSETNESVGGPIDVAVITRGDGFIWTKRKQYFGSEVNKNL